MPTKCGNTFSLAENSQAWKTENVLERGQPVVALLIRGGLINFVEREDIVTRLITLTKRVDNLLIKKWSQ